MALSTAIRTLILLDSTVSTAVGTRVFPVIVPQGIALPAISYHITNIQPSETKDEINEWIQLIDESNLKIDQKNQIKRTTNRLSTTSIASTEAKTPKPEKPMAILPKIDDRRPKEKQTKPDGDIIDIMGQIESHYKKESPDVRIFGRRGH